MTIADTIKSAVRSKRAEPGGDLRIPVASVHGRPRSPVQRAEFEAFAAYTIGVLDRARTDGLGTVSEVLLALTVGANRIREKGAAMSRRMDAEKRAAAASTRPEVPPMPPAA
jgi:hypothetical protein